MSVNGGAEAGAPGAPRHSAALGKYHLFARIGRGGMADVFLAIARGPMGFNKLAVLKRLREAVSDQTGMVDMFLDEARLAARLQHPNIVHTYEVGEHDGAYFIAMEYLEGQPLHKVSRSPVARAQLTPFAWCHIVACALAGLDHAHNLSDYDGTALGIVHRDISPHNIFLTYGGGVKVVDFGIAKAALNTTETASGVLKGKVNYMAPEQAMGDADRRADVYAMGLTLWELLAGKAAYRGDAVQVLNLVINEPVPSLAAACPDLDPRLLAIVDKATKKDREQRYQSAEEFSEALLSYIRACGEVVREAEIGKVLVATFHEIRDKLAAQVKLHMASVPPAPVPGGDPFTTTGRASLPSIPELSTTSTGTPPSHPKADAAEPRSGATAGRSDSADAHAVITENSGATLTPTPLPESNGRRSVAAALAIPALAVALAVMVAIAAWKLALNDPKIAGAPAPVSAPAQTSLVVVLESDPAGATIGLDGHVVGRTPRTVEVGAGPHALSLSMDGYGSEIVEVEVSPEHPRAQRFVTLRPEVAVNSAPSASASASGLQAAPTPPAATQAQAMPPRPRSHAPLPPKVGGASASASGASAAPEKGNGFLTLSTSPWSRVSEGGRPLGTTPLFRVPLSAGTHVLDLENPDEGLRTSYKVTIKPGEATSRSVALK